MSFITTHSTQLLGAGNILLVSFVMIALVHVQSWASYIKGSRKDVLPAFMIACKDGVGECFARWGRSNHEGTYTVSYADFKHLWTKMRHYGIGIIGVILIQAMVVFAVVFWRGTI